MHVSKFTIEGVGTFEGIDTGRTWNGWACPLFDFETATRALASMWASEVLFSANEESEASNSLTFDAQTRDFLMTDSDGRSESYGPDEDGFYDFSYLTWWLEDDQPSR
jgi:hypothetical protein